MQQALDHSLVGASTPGGFLAESLLESLLLPFFALVVTVLGRRVIAGDRV